MIENMFPAEQRNIPKCDTKNGSRLCACGHRKDRHYNGRGYCPCTCSRFRNFKSISNMEKAWRESNKFRLGDHVIASPLNPSLGWAGKRTGTIVGQGREPGLIRVSLDQEWGASHPETWWEGYWLLRDAPDTSEVLEHFEAAVQQTFNYIKTYLKSEPQARMVLQEAIYRIEQESGLPVHRHFPRHC
jgi:hypothetical protein